MAFKRYYYCLNIAVWVSLFISCHDVIMAPDTLIINNQSELISNYSYDATFTSTSTLSHNKWVIFNPVIRELQIFNPEPLSLDASLPIDETFEEPVFAVDQSNNFLIASPEAIAYLHQDGSTHQLDLSLNGDTISGVGFHRSQSYLFVRQRLFKVHFIAFNNQGDILKQVTGDDHFSTNEVFLSGTFLPNGNFVASLSNATVVVIDVPASLEAGEIKISSSFQLTGSAAGTTQVTSLAYLGAAPEVNNKVIALDNNRVVLIDLDQKKIIDERSINTSTMAVTSIRFERHMILSYPTANVGGSENLLVGYYLDNQGSLAVKQIPSLLQYLETPVHLTLTADAKELLLTGVGLVNQDGKTKRLFVKYDLEKNTVSEFTLVNEEQTKRSDFLLRSNEIVISHHSALGWIETLGYNQDESAAKHHKLFNLNILTQRNSK